MATDDDLTFSVYFMVGGDPEVVCVPAASSLDDLAALLLARRTAPHGLVLYSVGCGEDPLQSLEGFELGDAHELFALERPCPLDNLNPCVVQTVCRSLQLMTSFDNGEVTCSQFGSQWCGLQKRGACDMTEAECCAILARHIGQTYGWDAPSIFFDSCAYFFNATRACPYFSFNFSLMRELLTVHLKICLRVARAVALGIDLTECVLMPFFIAQDTSSVRMVSYYVLAEGSTTDIMSDSLIEQCRPIGVSLVPVADGPYANTMPYPAVLQKALHMLFPRFRPLLKK